MKLSQPPKTISPAVSDTGDPLLLTPGPLTTGKRVKEVMVHDWGSRELLIPQALRGFAHEAGIGAIDEQDAGLEVGAFQEPLDLVRLERGHAGLRAPRTLRRMVSARRSAARLMASAAAWLLASTWAPVL